MPSSKVIEIRRTPVLAGCQAQNSEGKVTRSNRVGYYLANTPCAHLLGSVKALQRAAALLDNALTIVAA